MCLYGLVISGNFETAFVFFDIKFHDAVVIDPDPSGVLFHSSDEVVDIKITALNFHVDIAVGEISDPPGIA